MTQALLHLPPSVSSVTPSSPLATGSPLLLFRWPICLKTTEQRYGGHLGGRTVITPGFSQRRLFPTRTGAPFQSYATMSLKMNGGEEFRGVVVGGTFDRLHQGHTLLLTKALSLVAQGGRLVVGISNGQLLSQKSLSELIEPFDIRLQTVEQYLKDLAESHGRVIDIRCLEILEAVPKTAVSDPQLDCIVVSQETAMGAHAFNKSREAMRLPPLKVVVVAVIPEKESEGEKFSSSSFRRRSLGTFIQRVKGERLSDGPLVTGPYMIGLTGGIASGKSFVRELLKDKGAMVLDCDALGHLSYILGTPTYYAMIAAFGRSIVSSVDGAIDRQILGSIVFTDPNQMEVLKKIVWVAVGHLVAEKREQMAEQGVEIFVAEAALLLEAQWEAEMHEIWVVFAPQDVSRHRLMSRNQISEEEANKRIRSQMDSEKRIALADVVICNGWTKDETKQQIDKAWDLLLQRVRSKLSQGKVEDPLWFRWAGLMRRLCINEEVALKWWPTLRSSYSEPWRHYYTFMHLRALYAHYHEYAHFIAQPLVFQLAVFFHRVVHHPSDFATNANEISSACRFDEFAVEAGLDDMDREKVKALILLTKQDLSDEAIVTGDLAFFVDFNLAVLASGSTDYREYRAKVRQEYKDYDDEHFQTLFKKQVQRYTNQTKIFHTSIFQLKYFSAARANLCDERSPKTPSASL